MCTSCCGHGIERGLYEEMWRLDGVALEDPARSLYIAYNGGSTALRVTLPEPTKATKWYRVADTAAWVEPYDNIDPPGQECAMNDRIYDLAGRSLAVFLQR